jgi:hypothetical protein
MTAARMRFASHVALTTAVLLLMSLPGEAAAETMESALARAYQGNPQLNAQRAIVRQNDEGAMSPRQKRNSPRARQPCMQPSRR